MAGGMHDVPCPHDGDGIARCDIGAFEIEGDVAELIFRDGFGD